MNEKISTLKPFAKKIWEDLKFSRMENTPSEWIVEDWIPKGEVSMYTGHFGSLKTYLEFFLTRAVSKGEKFAGKWAASQHNVLILDRQSSKATLTLRRNAVGLRDQDNIVVIGLHTQPNSLDIHVKDKVIHEICDIYQPLVFVDSLVDFVPAGASEQDPSTMGTVMRDFTKLTVWGAVGVVILHHKPKEDAYYRGTTAIPAATALCGSLSKRDEKDHTLVTVRQFKGRDTVEKTLKLRFDFTGSGEDRKVTCNFYSERQGDEPDGTDLELRVAQALTENPDLSANEIYDKVGGKRSNVLEFVKKRRGTEKPALCTGS